MSSDPKERPASREPASTDDRRASERGGLRGPVRLFVPEAELAGAAENASQGGVLFTSTGQLEVEVELEIDGRAVRRRGRLVRAVRMDGTTTAWAVEFVS